MNPNTGVDEKGQVICKRGATCKHNLDERCTLRAPRIDKRSAYANCLDHENKE